MYCRFIAPGWLQKEFPNIPTVVEGQFNHEETLVYNARGYNCYYLPNHPSGNISGRPISGKDIDRFNYVFVDCDLKDGVYASKEEFYNTLKTQEGNSLLPGCVVDSGNGAHAYWAVSDLDAMSYLRLSRRLVRKFKTDEAVGQIYQLMRIPGTINTKNPNEPKLCETLVNRPLSYTCEDLDKWLPRITPEDEEHCQRHFNKTYNIDQPIEVSEVLPSKFISLMRTNAEVQDIWGQPQDDRSTKDYRLGHIMLANGFSKEEATSVLVNTTKALERGPSHRISYASSIVDKIWIDEPSILDLSTSVADILSAAGDKIKGTRFPCHSYIDNTVHGFRLGQVIGLVAGSGVGKTAIALNMFLGFVKNNPDYEHFFIPLEQPEHEIASRWMTLVGSDSDMFNKVHIISNYDKEGKFRNLSLQDIKAYLLKFQSVTSKKIGCVVIDHIGALNHKDKDGENQGLMNICHSMKSFAIETNTMLIMQSQTSRDKAGIGDLEIGKDAAYGTVFFESYCDYLITLWQPLKRAYPEGAPTVTAFKFCKIRHKKQNLDAIKEDVCYRLMFDPQTEHLREMTTDEDKSFTFFLNVATNLRKADRKTDLVNYVSTREIK